MRFNRHALALGLLHFDTPEYGEDDARAYHHLAVHPNAPTVPPNAKRDDTLNSTSAWECPIV